MKIPGLKGLKPLHQILIIIIIIFVVLGLAKDMLIKTIVESGASFVTGAPVRIKSLAFGLTSSRVEIKGFKLYNPPGFPNEVLVDIPHVLVVYDLPAILTGRLHLPEMTLNLKEVVLIKDKEGKLNVDALKIAQQKEQPAPSKEKQKASKSVSMQLDRVKMNLGKVIVKDYSEGEPPIVLGYDIGIKDKTYENITSAQQLAVMILAQAMGPTALKSAGIYAAATILGVAFLPAGVAGILIGKDSASDTFNISFTTAYQKAKEVLTSLGEITQEENEKGIIQAKVKGSDITFSIAEKGQNQVEITVKARKLMIPRLELAQGILFQISEEVGK